MPDQTKAEWSKLIATVGILAMLGCTGCSSDGSQAVDAGNEADAGDAGNGDTQQQVTDDDLPNGAGHVVYHFQGHAYRIADQAGAVPEDISANLDPFEIAAGEDGAANLSADGQWLVLLSERFHTDCHNWACLVRVPSDLSAVEPILAGGATVHPEGFYAIATGGNAIIFTNTDGPHSTDIFITRHNGSEWSTAEVLSSGSSHAFHDFPALSADGSRVVFNCGPASSGSSGICEVGTDGSGFREVLMPSHQPPGMANPALSLHHPHYAPDGSIVFEGDWDGERIWRLAPGAAEPTAISATYYNDNSPCVLPSGRIASLWLDRPENAEGIHELKIMSADGSNMDLRFLDGNIDDWGLGCGQ